MTDSWPGIPPRNIAICAVTVSYSGCYSVKHAAKATCAVLSAVTDTIRLWSSCFDASPLAAKFPPINVLLGQDCLQAVMVTPNVFE